MTHNLSGILPAMITPFAREKLDRKAHKKNIKIWNETGLRGYLVAGSTGEAPFLGRKERLATIECTKEAMNPGMWLLVGCGQESTALTIKTCQDAAKAGADAALVITPWFYKSLMTGPALKSHFIAVAEASPIPVLLYNMPAFTGVTIPQGLVVSLADHPNIIGIKDSSGNVSYLSGIIRQVPADFAVFTGNAPTCAQALMLGATGAILAVANVVPEICVALQRAVEAQNLEQAQNLSKLIQPISEVVGGTYGIGGLKYAMSLLGYKAGIPRAPLSSPDKEQCKTIRKTLRQAGLLK